MFKEIAKTSNVSYDDISRQVYGTPAKASDIAKLNNNIESGNVLVFEEDSDTTPPKTNEVYIAFGKNIYKGFSEYVLFDEMEAIKGALFIFNKTEIDYKPKFNDFVTVFDEQGRFLKGRVANIKHKLTNEVDWIQVEIKSHAGILAETVMPYPLEFSNLSIKEVLLTVANYYNQNITFSDESELLEIFTNTVGTSFTAEIDESPFDFMKRICHSRGLILTDTGNGLFVGRFKSSTKEKFNIIEGECRGLTEISTQFITVGLARYYEANSQYPTPDSATVEIPFPTPITKRIISNDFNSLDLNNVATREACIDIGESFLIDVILSVNYPLKSGNFTVVKFPSIGITKEADWVIKKVERSHPDETHLILTLPCAYTFEIPEELPLCS